MLPLLLPPRQHGHVLCKTTNVRTARSEWSVPFLAGEALSLQSTCFNPGKHLGMRLASATSLSVLQDLGPRSCFAEGLSSLNLPVGWGARGVPYLRHKASPCPAPLPKAAGRWRMFLLCCLSKKHFKIRFFCLFVCF